MRKTFLIIQILFLMFAYSKSLKSQNLIQNPDFSDINIYYYNGKKVTPKNWEFFNFNSFSHLAQTESDFRSSRQKKSNGVAIIDINPVSNGITTKLAQKLESGNKYIISISMKFSRTHLNSDWGKKVYFMDGSQMDSTDYDYNFPIDLITYFSRNKPSTDIDERFFNIFDLPDSANPDQPEWYNLETIYTANGTEEYFSIGTFNPHDYIDILRTIRNDTIDYRHKFARYLIRKVCVTPFADSIVNSETASNNIETSIKIASNFEPNFIQDQNPHQKYIFKRVNFELSSFELTDSAKQEINKIANFMQENLSLNIEITGHTDSIGTIEYNQTLSEKRAYSVYIYLINNGITKNRLSYVGFGEKKPLNKNQYENNNNLNRRVEFVFKK